VTDLHPGVHGLQIHLLDKFLGTSISAYLLIGSGGRGGGGGALQSFLLEFLMLYSEVIS
jgi:hypothetical protein